ncbi:RelA/SpoT family protein [Bacteroides propionicifaciens]|uniref:RelA/SpoT family protein n=1 Tax=Bacteroides propionicifaciens TaxID=392838 RepID=UPI0003789DD5|nr:RelA/SpoT family protein [Bacteroides propionicifaciens]
MNEMTDKEMTEEAMIQNAFQELLNDYLATKHRKRIEIITKAFNFANEAHKGIRRRSGEPYILHPIAVAKIVCNEIGLGSTSICSALLHDVVEDTDYTVEDIENIFGPKIAQIVDGLTKISGGIFGERASAQAENFKKLLLTMSSDVRVILIKIADRLHNMRTLGAMLPSKQYKIAGETLYIYAPLANRLGLYKIKTELENLSFKYEHPQEYQLIQSKLDETASEREAIFKSFTTPIRAELDKMGIKYKLIARIKSTYSIWNKMQTKHIPFEEIYDILAVRIIFEPRSRSEELNDCFDIYVAVSKIYKPHPDRLRDWVSHPKANGYQALHITLMAGNGQWIEVQIRSERMNDIAEQGFAAHWKYKEGGGGEDEGELEKWLKTIKEILDDPQPDAMDFLDTIKLNLFASEIFVFTPKGDIKTMPQNSTALDFAFSLHSDIGVHCIGAKVNHKLVPLSHKLESGDQVEILTSVQERVEPYWTGFATTAKAKSEIASYLRKKNRILQMQGEEILVSFFKDIDIKQDPSLINKLLQLHNKKNKEDLTKAIGEGEIILGQIEREAIYGKQVPTWKKYLTFSFGNKPEKEEVIAKDIQPIESKIDTKKTLLLKADELNTTYQLASCCHPIPGDPVLGYLDENRHLFIHKRQCPVATRLKSSFGNRILATAWDEKYNNIFPIIIYIKGIDSLGLLSDITEVFSKKLNINIRDIKFNTEDGIFEGRVKVNVQNVDDVNQIYTELKKIPSIKQVSRIEEE